MVLNGISVFGKVYITHEALKKGCTSKASFHSGFRDGYRVQRITTSLPRICAQIHHTHVCPR